MKKTPLNCKRKISSTSFHDEDNVIVNDNTNNNNNSNSNTNRKLDEDDSNISNDERCIVCGLLFSDLASTATTSASTSASPSISIASITETHIRNCLLLGGVSVSSLSQHVSKHGYNETVVVGTDTVINIDIDTDVDDTDSDSDSDTDGDTSTIDKKNSTVEVDACGLLEKSFYCVLCDINLSRRCLLSRCKHLKQCAKQNRVATRELLTMIGSTSVNTEGVGIEAMDAIDELSSEVLLLPSGTGTDRYADGVTKTVDFFKPRHVPGVHKGSCVSSSSTTSSGSSSSRNSSGEAIVIVIDDSDDEDDGGFHVSPVKPKAVIGGSGGSGSGNDYDVVTTDTPNHTTVPVTVVTEATPKGKDPPQNAFSFLMRGAMSVASAIGISSGNNSDNKNTSLSEKSKSKSTSSGSVTPSKFTSTSTSKWEKKKNTSGTGGSGWDGPAKYGIPSYKKIQIGSTAGSAGGSVVMSVPIVVDGFQWASGSLTDCYFLTHFHSDHTVGLKSSFNYGMTLAHSLVYLTIAYISIYPYTKPTTYLPTYLPVYLPVYLPTYLPI